MVSIKATDVERDFDSLLRLTQQQPVHVQEGNRDVAVVVSPEEYQRLTGEARVKTVNPLIIEQFQKSLVERGSVYEALARWEAEHPEASPDVQDAPKT